MFVMLTTDQKQKLQDLYQKKDQYAKIFDILSNRKQNRSETPIDSIIADLSDSSLETRQLVIEFFRKLEETGAGRLMVGRKGRKTRFCWDEGTTLTEVGSTASSPNGSHPSAQPSHDAAHQVTLLSHSYNLRADFTVGLRLPSDLTRSEAKRLSEFILTLPFESSNEEDR
jgi:hypothetical protein